MDQASSVSQVCCCCVRPYLELCCCCCCLCCCRLCRRSWRSCTRLQDSSSTDSLGQHPLRQKLHMPGLRAQPGPFPARLQCPSGLGRCNLGREVRQQQQQWPEHTGTSGASKQCRAVQRPHYPTETQGGSCFSQEPAACNQHSSRSSRGRAAASTCTPCCCDRVRACCNIG